MTWLITFATYRRRPVFDSPELLEVCASAIQETTDRNGYRIYALAIMPDHVHVVLDAGRSGHKASKVLNNLKGVASRRVFQACPGLKLDLNSEHLWADEYQAKLLREAQAVERACRYVDHNPARHALPRQEFPWVPISGLSKGPNPSAAAEAIGGP